MLRTLLMTMLVAASAVGADPGRMVDLSHALRRRDVYEVGVAEVAAWEKAHGAIPAGAIVFLACATWARTSGGPAR